MSRGGARNDPPTAGFASTEEPPCRLRYFAAIRRSCSTVLGVLAMVAFVLSDSVPRYLNSSTGGRDQKVAELYGTTVYQSQLNEMARQRSRANLFIAAMAPFLARDRDFFGGLKTARPGRRPDPPARGRPAGHAGHARAGPGMAGRAGQELRGRMTDALLDAASTAGSPTRSAKTSSSPTSPTRSACARSGCLLGSPVVTPYDVFRAYREQNERVGAKVVEVPVETFLSQVPEPSPSEVQAYFDQYKDVLPDPASETPGFKVPRAGPARDPLARRQRPGPEHPGQADRGGAAALLREPQVGVRGSLGTAQGPVRRPARPDPAGPSSRSPTSAASWPPGSPTRRPRPRSRTSSTRSRTTTCCPFVDKYLAALDEQEDTKKQANAAQDRSAHAHRSEVRGRARGPELREDRPAHSRGGREATGRSPPPRSG